MDSGDYVGLNVGGKIYRTSRTTLTRYPDSFFTTMLDGSVPSARDDQGNYLIDRDGKIFRHVLNYLRCGELVVPENFSEFGLLEREADFFLLKELKLLTRKPLSTHSTSEAAAIGLMFDNGKLFNTTRKTLLRDEDSFFTKMLNGEVTVPRDSQGNYVMDRDGSHFHRVIQYLRDGGIFSTTDFDHLKKEAKYFQLKELTEHIESINKMRSRARVRRRNLLDLENLQVDNIYEYNAHFYFRLDSPSVAYTCQGSYILETEYPVGDGAVAGVVDLQKITREEPVTLQHVLNHFKIFNSADMERKGKFRRQLISAHCTKLEFYDVSMF